MSERKYKYQIVAMDAKGYLESYTVELTQDAVVERVEMYLAKRYAEIRITRWDRETGERV